MVTLLANEPCSRETHRSPFAPPPRTSPVQRCRPGLARPPTYPARRESGRATPPWVPRIQRKPLPETRRGRPAGGWWPCPTWSPWSYSGRLGKRGSRRGTQLRAPPGAMGGNAPVQAFSVRARRQLLGLAVACGRRSRERGRDVPARTFELGRRGRTG